jgi:hypothetical protein
MTTTVRSGNPGNSYEIGNVPLFSPDFLWHPGTDHGSNQEANNKEFAVFRRATTALASNHYDRLNLVRPASVRRSNPRIGDEHMKATTFASALLLVLAGVCHAALADEEIAPPTRRAPPAREDKSRRTDKTAQSREGERRARDGERGARKGERGERLRNLGGQLLGAIAADPSQPPKALDVLKLNDGIVELLKPLFENENSIESFKLGFDPEETNFAKDSVKLVASTRLKHSAWSPEPSQIDLAVGARIQRGEKGANQARYESQLTVVTDVVPLANHAIAKFLKMTDPERSRGSRAADSAVREQIRERLLKTPQVSSMDELADLVVGLTALRLTSMNDQIVELSEKVGAEADGPTKQRLTTELAKARLERDQLFDVRPRVERDASGKVVAIHFTMDRSEVAVAGQADHLLVAITAEQITAEVAGTLVEGMEAYALLKPVVTSTLSRIQDRDPDTLRMGQGLLNGYIRQGREAVLDEKE